MQHDNNANSAVGIADEVPNNDIENMHIDANESIMQADTNERAVENIHIDAKLNRMGIEVDAVEDKIHHVHHDCKGIRDSTTT